MPEMIKSIANGCYQNGIPKKNIHFELFETFNEDIYPVEKEFPLLENIDVEFKIFKNSYQTQFEDNKTKILRKECEFFESIYEKCKEIKQHNFAIKALFCNTTFCSKALNELKENKWKIYNDFM